MSKPAMRGFTLKRKMLFLVAIVNIAFTGAFSAYLFYAQKKLIMNDIDHKLLSSALAVRHILPDGFHGRVVSASSVKEDEYMRHVRDLSLYANEVGVTYLYTLIVSGDKFFFTSTSATDEEFQKNEIDPFYTEYEDASDTMRKSVSSRKIMFENYEDKYGYFRSVIIPVTLPDGRVYIMGADMDISAVKALVLKGTRKGYLIGLFLFTLSMVISVLILKPFTASIIEVKEQVEEIIENQDLTRNIVVNSRDEIRSISRDINALLDLVRDIINRLKESSSMIGRTSEDLASNSSDLASRTSEQNESMTQTSMTLQDLAGVISRNTRDAIGVESSLKEFSQKVNERMELITDVTRSMNEINSSGMQIENIIGVINEIAFRTNLLALNASVEAARAGEAGKGFSVVASEVRSLAQKTAESSRDIQHIVRGNMEAARNGMELVKETTEFFNTVIEQISGLADRVSLIAEGSRGQNRDIEQINEALARTRTILERDVELVRVLSESSSDLHANVNAMEELIGTFKCS